MSAPRIARGVLLALTLGIALVPLIPAPSVFAPEQPIQALAPVQVFATGFEEPTGLAYDGQGRLYVSDRKAGLIIELELHNGTFARSVLASGLKKPVGLAFDGDGHLYVAEEGAGRLLRFRKFRKLTGLLSTTPEVVAQDLKHPRWLAFGPAGDLYVYATAAGLPGSRGGRDRGKPPGDLVLRVPTNGGPPTICGAGFKGLQGLLFDAAGGLVLAAKRHRGAGGEARGPLFSQASPCTGPLTVLLGAGLEKPQDLKRDRLEALFVSAEEAEENDEEEKGRDGEDSEDGGEEGLIGKRLVDGRLVYFARGLERPRGLAFDANGNLYVAETGEERLLRFLAPPAPSLDHLRTFTNDPTATLLVTGKIGEGTAHAGALVTILGGPAPATGLADAQGRFAIPVPLTRNTQNDLKVLVTGAGGLGLTSPPAEAAVTHDDEAPTIHITAPLNNTQVTSPTVIVRGTVEDANLKDVTVNGVPAIPTGTTYQATGIPLAVGQNTLTATATDLAGNTATTRVAVTRLAPGAPDPSTAAPPLDRTVATTLAAATEFLYTGGNPIQTGVAPGTIEAKRAAVLRGRVLARDGSALSGATISILHHPEYGSTRSRTDGFFDLAVNGGSQLTVRYEKAGFLPAQRSVTPPWQEYAWLPDVVLVPYDARATAIDLGAPAPIQVARGSPVTDSDGSRQATLLFPQGTTATMLRPDGTTQALTTLTVRATEYTVGPKGPHAMPAPLPPNSAYTYAVELSADEAVAGGVKVGGKDVLFNRPVPFYVENFLSFPVGGIVPVGYYDNDRAAWVPSDNGRVIKVLSISGGLAQLDITGSGGAADAAALAALGITEAERQHLAGLYGPGQSLWRVAITHFSTWDANWGWGPPPDAILPGQPQAKVQQPLDCPAIRAGSTIECQNQILGEAVEVVGTPYRLHYQSDRIPGRKTANTLEIPLSGPSIPASLKRIELEVMVAGQRVTRTLPATPHQRYTFTWDGQDAYGRALYGAHPVTLRIGYVYNGVYQQPSALYKAFGYNGSGLLVANRTRQEVTLWQEQHTTVGTVSDARAVGLGGWTLDIHHTYDPGGQVLSRGDGGRHSATDVGTVITTVTTGAFWGLTVDGQGTVFFSDGRQVKKWSPDGTVTVIAGTGTPGFSGDGSPATAAHLNSPYGLAVDSQGTLFIADYQNHRIRKVSPDGIITTVAGNGTCCGPGRGGGNFSGDGGPATQAALELPWGVTVDGQGNLFISDTGNSRIRKVSPDGIITTVAGSGVFAFGFSGDGGPATSAQLSWPAKVAVDAQGTLYIPDHNNNRVRKVSPEGIITTVAGTGPLGLGAGGYTGDGSPATAAQLNAPLAVAVDAQGNLYLPDHHNHRIRKVSPEGIITTVAGTGSPGFSGDGGPATSAQLNGPYAVAVDAQGTLYIADGFNGRIRKLTSALPGFADQDLTIPSADGSELYAFTASGRHLRTLNALTGAVRSTFTYDAAGRLSTVTDGDGNVTTIERDASGAPSAVVAPFGQRTLLTLDPNGYLASVADPAGNATRFTATPDGLLTTLTTPRGHVAHFTYDALGRLTQDTDPAGGTQTLTRTGTATTFTTTLTTALNRTSTYLVERLPTGGTRRVDTDPSGTQTVLQRGPDGRTTTTAPDGTVSTLLQGPDPRFGMQAPLPASLTVTTPSGLTSTLTTSRTATLADPTNLLSLTTQTDMMTLNGRPYISTFEAALRRITDRSPAGRQTITLVDPQGRILQEQVPGLAPLTLTYDPRGRLTTLTHGTGPTARLSSLTYNPQGFLSTLTDPLTRTVQFAYDAAGRLTTQTLPDGRLIQYTYDANGNVTAITPPSRPAHTFTYTPVDLEASYTPPAVDATSPTTTYTYNLDRQVTQITRPDATTLTLDYDAGGRLSTLTLPRGVFTYAYHPTTGQLTSLTAPDGTTLTYTHDGVLRTATTWTGPVSGSVAHTYNSDFRLATESVNGANPVALAYDPDGLLTAAGALALTRDPQHGLLTGSTLGSLTDTRTYSSFGEVSAYRAALGTTDLLVTQFTRDSLGRITQKTETLGAVTDTYAYTYDAAGRLTDVSKNGTTIAHYTYDGNGNRLSVTRPSGTVSGTYDAQDRLLTYGAFTYTYTASGGLQTATEGGRTTTYTYDPLGNLMSVTLPDGRQIEYLIDGQNRRVGKKVNSSLVQAFLYRNQLAPVAELDAAGNIVARFVYASRPHVPDYMVKGGVTYRLLTDHLGSPRLVVDSATGTIAQRLDYDEFGQITRDTNPGFQPFGFAGGLSDPHTGLLRFGARGYDAFTGRWTTKDPILFAGGDTNLYGYVLNDPVNNFDPDGQVVLEATLLFLAGQALAITIAYTGVKLAQLAANAAAAVTCQPKRIGNREINKALKIAAVASVAPAAKLAILETGLAAAPAVTTAVIQRPKLIQSAGEFIQGAVVPGLPPPTPAGVAGFLSSTAVAEVLRSLRE